MVDNTLAQLLEGEGYATRVLKTFPMGEAQVEEEKMPVGGVDLMVLASSLSTSECEAFLAARRRINLHRITTHASPIPVIVLCTLTREAPALLEEEEQAVRSVPRPTSRERLVHEIDASTDPPIHTTHLTSSSTRSRIQSRSEHLQRIDPASAGVGATSATS